MTAWLAFAVKLDARWLAATAAVRNAPKQAKRSWRAAGLCGVCHGSLEGRRRDVKYCSGPCARLAENARAVARNGAP